MDIKKSIRNWVKLITGIQACPFAHRTLRENRILIYEEGTNPSSIKDLSPEFDVGLILMLGCSDSELENLCNTLNKETPELIFLDSHPNQVWEVRGHRTAWEYPAILIQRRSELESAREELLKRGFYSDWDPKFLKILKVI